MYIYNHEVMRACEGCRRRKIKCDAATTNTWPCSACVRLKLQCVRPNGFDGSTTTTTTTTETATTTAASSTSTSTTPTATSGPTQGPSYESSGRTFHNASTAVQGGFAQQQMLNMAPKTGASIYQQATFADSQTNLFQPAQYPDTQPPSQHNMHYTGVVPPVNVVNETYPSHDVFPTPPLQTAPAQESSPGSYSQDSYSHSDLADLLGSLKVNEAGTGKEAHRHLSQDSTASSILITVILSCLSISLC